MLTIYGDILTALEKATSRLGTSPVLPGLPAKPSWANGEGSLHLGKGRQASLEPAIYTSLAVTLQSMDWVLLTSFCCCLSVAVFAYWPILTYIDLYWHILSYIFLYCPILTYIDLYCPILTYIVLYCPILTYIVLYWPILSYIDLYCPILTYIDLYCPILSYIDLYWPILSYIDLYCPILSYIVQYCPILTCSVSVSCLFLAWCWLARLGMARLNIVL